MGPLFLFILISLLVISALLFFNKGEKAQEIKSLLKDIYENFKELLSNLKKLFLILKNLIQTTFDKGETQQEDKSSSDDSQESASSDESTSPVTIDLSTPSENSIIDSNESEPEGSPEPDIISPIELETPSNDLNNENNVEIKNE